MGHSASISTRELSGTLWGDIRRRSRLRTSWEGFVSTATSSRDITSILTTVRPFGAYLYGFRESTFIAILSFQPSSSAFCHGVSVDGSRNLTSTPATKHCQEGVGQECDHVWGERRGEEGAGDEDDTPESA